MMWDVIAGILGGFLSGWVLGVITVQKAELECPKCHHVVRFTGERTL